jgi:transposase-like protein
MEIGYRESKASWGDLLRQLQQRGLRSPLLVIGDGNLGIWAGLAETYPEARRQRCWNHYAEVRIMPRSHAQGTLTAA